MPIPRQYILRGPCQALLGSVPFYTKDNAVVAFNPKTQPLTTDAIGKIDILDDDFEVQITLTPDGQITPQLLIAFYPYIVAAIYPGSGAFGDVDVPLILWTRDNWKYTFACTAVTKQPDFIAQGVKTVFGSLTITAIRQNNTAWNTPGSFVTSLQAAYPGDSPFHRANIITEPFTGLWTPPDFTAPVATVSADTDANPDVITTEAAHGFVPGDRVLGAGFAGDVAPNGIFYVGTTPSAETLTLNALNGTPVAGTGEWTSGGTLTRANGFDGAFPTEAGFTISTNVTLKDEMTDPDGIVDKTFVSIDVMAKCVPVGPTPQELIALMGIQDAGAARGRAGARSGAISTSPATASTPSSPRPRSPPTRRSAPGPMSSASARSPSRPPRPWSTIRPRPCSSFPPKPSTKPHLNLKITMPTDLNGQILKKGQAVLIPATIVSLTDAEGGANVVLELDRKMDIADGTLRKTPTRMSGICTNQILLNPVQPPAPAIPPAAPASPAKTAVPQPPAPPVPQAKTA